MDPARTQLDWIDSQRDRMIDLVRAWSEINSGSRNIEGLGKCASVIAREFERLGGNPCWIDLAPLETIDSAGRVRHEPLGRVLQIVKRPDAPIRVLLAIHYDTVFGPEDPFQSVTLLDSNTLRGPGVADAKGGLVVLRTALETIERSGMAENLGWEILLNPDEELGSPGSSHLFTEAAKRNQVGLLFEPALPDGSLVGRRKGSGNFTAVITGRAAHAGRDVRLGRNAIHAMAEFIVGLQGIPRAMPGITVNVGKVEGGGPVNIVPDLAIARFNLRVDSIEQQIAADTRLRELIADLNARDGFTARLHGGFSAPPKPLDPSTQQLLDQILACGNGLGLSLKTTHSGGVCDGNRLAAAGLPTIDTLGPRGGHLHSADEYLLLDSLTERAKLCASLLLNYATGRMTPPPKSQSAGGAP